MPRTPDRRPGPLIEDEEIILVANASPPSVDGAFNYDGTSFKMRDSFGTFNPRSVLASATAVGQVLSSIDGVNFTPQTPLVGNGWLANAQGRLLVKG